MRELAQTILVALLVLGQPYQAASTEGWLLLLPPLDREKLPRETTGASTYPFRAVVDATAGAFLLPEAPLQQWEQFRAFDSAAACEAWRTGIQNEAETAARAALHPENHGPQFSLAELLISIRYAQGMEARCLPVSAVYPPQALAAPPESRQGGR